MCRTRDGSEIHIESNVKNECWKEKIVCILDWNVVALVRWHSVMNIVMNVFCTRLEVSKQSVTF
jgi:hypothetical protein